MGKKRYNWKSRQVVNTIVDDSTTKQIKIDIDVDGKYDKSNEFVLPAHKRNTKIKRDNTKITKILSRKHRKRLEKIVEKKQKKQQRAVLLEELSAVRATPEELSNLTSIASMQTKGLKKYFLEEQNKVKRIPPRDLAIMRGEIKMNSLKGAKRKMVVQEPKIVVNDPNVVGFESSGSDSESEAEIEEVQAKKQKIDDPIVEEPIEIKEDADEVVLVEEPINPPVVVERPIELPVVAERTPAIFVEVDRTDEIQKARLKLPILAEEQQIMEVINENSIVIIAGETGSGKTTQVPQFLYEAGYALEKQICVTEPRRVAAISMSKRVAEEMNLTSKEVSYLIRFEGNATEETKIKFVTDGVLLKEVQKDFFLKKYSVIILDEAHERSVYTDILIGFLSAIVPMRIKKGDPLKLIIMSATLRLEDFTENARLFKVPPPVINVDTRQFPVTVHFNKRTEEDYLKVAFDKVVKLHNALPEGGVLVFVTGQQEVNSLVRKLRRTFPFKRKHWRMHVEGSKHFKNRRKVKIIPQIDLEDFSLPGDTETDVEGELSDLDDGDEFLPINNYQPLWVLPLYSLLPSEKQAEVFKPPPEGCRLCIVSTNVAETSLTIPNIKYVVDTGKTKVKLYDKTTGVTSYVVSWTSKASANQRAGRAGRLGPGHCYRLYSSAVFNDEFNEFSVPEIQQKPVDDLYLQMKCMYFAKIVNFPFPTAPDMLQLKTAEHRLEILGALEEGKVTPLGRAISKYPVLPRYGKMITLSHQHGLLPYTVCLVAALSVQEVLLEKPIVPTGAEETKDVGLKWAGIRQRWAGTGNSLLLGDNMILLKAVGGAEYANFRGKLDAFCKENGLRHKAILEIRKLRLQLTNNIKTNIPEVELIVDPKLVPPTDTQIKLLRQLLLSGLGDQVAKKITPGELKQNEAKAKFKYAYRANNMEEPVFLHQGSVLKKTLPSFVVYQEIYETNKMYMRGVTAIEPEWLPLFVPFLCNLSEPLTDPAPQYNRFSDKIFCTVTGTFGTQAWPLGKVEVEFPKNLDLYKWFARFFLEGKVFRKLERYSSSLLNPPSIMVKTWANLHQRTGMLLKVLVAREISSKKTLVDIWKTHPKFLLHEYLQWLPQSDQNAVALAWPPLD